IDLLIELLDVARQREDMSTAMLLHHFAGREQADALAALAITPLQISGDATHTEFVDALRQLQRQTLVQRIDHLIETQASRGLDNAEKAQLRELLAAKSQPA
ncbi:MAG: DNA primase, partial [Xanthomonadales bacterium]|nr:DNA primase [Xanthomonadales bacterium]